MTNNKNPNIISQKTTIAVVYAGGTISSLATSAGYREGGHVVDLVGLLKEKNPNLDNFIIDKTEVAYTGLSENIDEKYWEKIEEVIRKVWNKNTNAIIVTHGTDSMEQTARRLKHIFNNELKKSGIKIILTGANDDISHQDTDAWDNLMFAFESTNANNESDVYVAFHRRLIPADLVVKEPFDGYNMNFVSKNDPDYVAAVKTQEEKEQELIVSLRRSKGGTPNIQGVVEYAVNVVRKGHDEFIR